MARGWRKLHEDHNLYIAPDIPVMIKSERIKRAEHVVRVGRYEIFTKFWLWNLRFHAVL